MDDMSSFRLTIDTVVNMREGMVITDLYGHDHHLSKLFVGVMIGAGWAFFVISWIINVAYYKFHPSSVDVLSFSDKKILHVFGVRFPRLEDTKKQNVEGKIKKTIVPYRYERLVFKGFNAYRIVCRWRRQPSEKEG